MIHPLIPAKAGTQGFGRKAAKFRTSLVQRTAEQQNWVPVRLLRAALRVAGISGV